MKLANYESAEEQGRLVILPCAIGSTVYTIKENYFDCKNCEHKAHARYRDYIQKAACDMDGWRCPLSVEEHIVEGFEVGQGETGCAEVSAPGAWGYEGLETFSGRDGKWYCTRAEAEKALKLLEESTEDA